RPVVHAYRMTHVVVLVQGRGLAPGEELILTLGDRSGGGPGSRAQTTYECQHYFDLSVDAAGDGRWVALTERPCVAIRGADAVALVAVAPSIVERGEPFRLLIRAQDAWGNPSSTYRGRVRISLPGGEAPREEAAFTAESDGVTVLEGFCLNEPGIHRVAIHEIDGTLHTESNPILCLNKIVGPRLYWGEPHGG
ncbi:MAG: hypothetical protein H5T70_12830, partial [Chloroflexi bacterium]|nr:hypothetical protein [Chloroflexota bacterium]